MKNLFFVLITLASISSCAPTLEQQLANYAKNIDISSMPLPQPVDSEANVNAEIAALYEAQAAEVTVYGSLKYDPVTKKQVPNQYWLRAKVQEPTALDGVNDPSRFQELARQIANDVDQRIKNSKDYDKIEIIILSTTASGAVLERNYFFRLPDLLAVIG